MCFDGHHLELEDEFAFSLIETREAWEREQEEHRRFCAEMDRAARERAAGADAADPFGESTWQTSFVNWEALVNSSASPRQLLRALAFPLAELVSDLQHRPDGVDLWRSLNGVYGGLRESQEPVARDSATQQLREALEAASEKFPDLTAKCADLQSRLDQVLRQLS